MSLRRAATWRPGERPGDLSPPRSRAGRQLCHAEPGRMMFLWPTPRADASDSETASGRQAEGPCACPISASPSRVASRAARVGRPRRGASDGHVAAARSSNLAQMPRQPEAHRGPDIPPHQDDAEAHRTADRGQRAIAGVALRVSDGIVGSRTQRTFAWFRRGTSPLRYDRSARSGIETAITDSATIWRPGSIVAAPGGSTTGRFVRLHGDRDHDRRVRPWRRSH